MREARCALNMDVEPSAECKKNKKKGVFVIIIDAAVHHFCSSVSLKVPKFTPEMPQLDLFLIELKNSSQASSVKREKENRLS